MIRYNQSENRQGDFLLGEISAKDREKYLQRLKLLRPIDDIFMRRLFKDNIPITELLLKTILEKDDLIVTSVTTQSDFKQLTGIRSVTFDVDAIDSTGKRYDIEFQNESGGAKPERARFHSSVLDTASLKATEDFEQLPETYVIFITGKDYFGKGEAVYPIERINLVTGEKFNDRSHIVYVNSEYKNDNAIGRLLHDLCCSDPQEMYNDLIRKDTEYLKTNTQEVESMCQIIEELVNEVRAESKAQGMVEGIAIGENKGRAEGTQNALTGLAEEMKVAGITEEMIKAIIASYQEKAEANKEA